MSAVPATKGSYYIYIPLMCSVIQLVRPNHVKVELAYGVVSVCVKGLQSPFPYLMSYVQHLLTIYQIIYSNC